MEVIEAAAVAAAPAFPWSLVLPYLIPAAGAVVVAYFALRQARGTKGTEDRKVNADEFRIFRETMQGEYSRLNARVGDLEVRLSRRNDAVRETNKRYNRLREALVDFVHRVTESWGQLDAPPQLTPHQLELLAQPTDPDDLDLTAPHEAVREARMKGESQ